MNDTDERAHLAHDFETGCHSINRTHEDKINLFLASSFPLLLSVRRLCSFIHASLRALPKTTRQSNDDSMYSTRVKNKKESISCAPISSAPSQLYALVALRSASKSRQSTRSHRQPIPSILVLQLVSPYDLLRLKICTWPSNEQCYTQKPLWREKRSHCATQPCILSLPCRLGVDSAVHTTKQYRHLTRHNKTHHATIITHRSLSSRGPKLEGGRGCIPPCRRWLRWTPSAPQQPGNRLSTGPRSSAYLGISTEKGAEYYTVSDEPIEKSYRVHCSRCQKMSVQYPSVPSWITFTECLTRGEREAYSLVLGNTTPSIGFTAYINSAREGA